MSTITNQNVVDQELMDHILRGDINFPENYNIGDIIKIGKELKKRGKQLNQEEVDKILVEMGIEKKEEDELDALQKGFQSGRILSDDDVDSLLRGLCSSDGEFKSNLKAKNIQTNQLEEYYEYNILDNDRIVRGRLPGLETISDIFSSKLSQKLSKIIQKSIQINTISIDIVNLGNYIKTLIVPTPIDHFVDNYLNNFYLIYDSSCRQNYADLFIAKGNLPNDEYEMLKDYINYCITKKTEDIINYSFSKFLPKWKCKLVDHFQRPQCISTSSIINEPVVIVAFEVEIEHNISSMTLAIPFTLASQFKKYLNQSNVHPDFSINKQVLENITNNVEIDISLMFKKELTFKDILNLQIDQTIVFENQHIIVENELNHEMIFELSPPKDKKDNNFQVDYIRPSQSECKLKENKEFYTIPEYTADKPVTILTSIYQILQKLLGEPECQKI